jgi:uncharacterized protein YcbK (DUF882 family)
MRSLIVCMATALAIAGAANAQTTSTGEAQTDVIRGATESSTAPGEATKPAAPAKPAYHKAAAVQVVRPPVHNPTTPQSLRGSRYGGFAPSTVPPPPQIDMTVPRTISLLNVNTKEALTVTYWSDGTYHRDALDQLNHFCRDSQNNQQTEMDPLLFDVLWQTMQAVGYGGTVEVLSAYRSPTTNAWLASMSRGVARDSQHMNGNAMDIRFGSVPVFKIRQAARSLQMGGVGFYPRSGFVHLDTGPIRYW